MNLDREAALALVAAAEERAERATPGPWRDAFPDDVYSSAGWIVQDDGTTFGKDVTGIDYDGGTRKEDVAFIAAARSDVPALCAALRAYEAALVGMEHHLRLGIASTEKATARAEAAEAYLHVAVVNTEKAILTGRAAEVKLAAVRALCRDESFICAGAPDDLVAVAVCDVLEIIKEEGP